MVQIITDSSALTTPAEGKALGIDVIPLCVSILDEEYRDLQVNMDYFYVKLPKAGFPEAHSRRWAIMWRPIGGMRARRF